jgi:DNA-binding MarR family transcriptional regulator
MTNNASVRLHEALMELGQVTALFHPDQTIPGESVSMSQVFALHELDVAAPMSQRDLAVRLCLEKSTVSRMVADLERKKLLVRERDPDNRRLYRLRLTTQGRTAHRRIARHFHQQYLRWEAAMTQAERDALLIGLPALVRAIRGDLTPRESTAPDS